MCKVMLAHLHSYLSATFRCFQPRNVNVFTDMSILRWKLDLRIACGQQKCISCWGDELEEHQHTMDQRAIK